MKILEIGVVAHQVIGAAQFQVDLRLLERGKEVGDILL